MKFFGIDIGWSKNKKPLTEQMKQPDTLLLCIADHVKKGQTDWKVQVLYVNQKTLQSAPIMTTKVVDFAGVVENVEDYLRERFGAALFRVAIYHPTGVVAASYEVPVGGPKAYRGAGAGSIVNREGDGDGTDKKLDPKLEGFVAMMTAFKSLQEDGGMKELMLEIVKGQLSGGGSSKLEDLAEKMLITNFNNDVNSKENEIDRIKSLVELSRMFSPNMPEENLISSLIQAGGPVIASLLNKGGAAPGVMAAPAGIAALPPGGNGGIDIKALAGQIAQLPPAEQLKVIQDMSSGAPAPQAGVPLARPGAPVETVGDGVGVNASSALAPPLVDNTEAHHAAIDTYIADIRQDLRGQATDNQVAQKILAMITAARGFTSSRPHPLLKKLMEADEKTGPAAFVQFCRAIPELQYQDERIDSIGQEIIAVMEQGAAETIDVIRDGEEPQQTPEAPGDLTFEYETAADLANAQTEAPNANEHAPGSAGIPEQGRKVESGEQQDSSTDRAADAADEDYAEAV